MSSTEFAGRTALVTGSTSGIGRATAVQLAQAGATVLVSGRDAERGALVVKDIQAAGGQAQFLQADLSSPDGARELAAAAMADGRAVDILINNAGIFPFGATADITDEQLTETFAVNVSAPHVLVGALAPTMAERGQGAIVNLITLAAERGGAQMGLYGATKAALALLTRAWSDEFGPSGVRVNAVSPGPTRTEGTAPMGDMLDQFGASGPARRAAEPDEIAAAIVFLASDKASYVHGATLPVDGGITAV